jgi:hypothetical protein
MAFHWQACSLRSGSKILFISLAAFLICPKMNRTRRRKELGDFVKINVFIMDDEMQGKILQMIAGDDNLRRREPSIQSKDAWETSKPITTRKLADQ